MLRAITTASFISLHLARFDQLRAAGSADPGERPGLLFIDPPTLSFWDDEASMVAWAHRQATHTHQMDRYRTTGNADRASFTRLTALHSNGTWYGVDPVAIARAHGLDGSGCSSGTRQAMRSLLVGAGV
jgi:hypothetical protein